MSGQDNKFKNKLKLRQRRTFSEEFKRQKAKELVNQQISIHELSRLYDVSKMSIYRWIYKYSPHHKKGTTQVVQMNQHFFLAVAFISRIQDLMKISCIILKEGCVVL